VLLLLLLLPLLLLLLLAVLLLWPLSALAISGAQGSAMACLVGDCRSLILSPWVGGWDWQNL
jgi:hypothetical protein